MEPIKVDASTVAQATAKENEGLSLHQIIENGSMSASMLSRASRRHLITWTCSYCPATVTYESNGPMLAAHSARLAGWTYQGAFVSCPGCNLL